MLVAVEAVHFCSGAGKSTVAALLSRFYAPDSGDILLDGQSASSFTRGEWARAISIVQQEPVLFGGTVVHSHVLLYSTFLPMSHYQQWHRSYIYETADCLLRQYRPVKEGSCSGR